MRGFTDIPGWFYWLDYLLFRALLRSQAASPPGVLVEIGAYLGKSAVVIGEHVRPGEELVVSTCSAGPTCCPAPRWPTRTGPRWTAPTAR